MLISKFIVISILICYLFRAPANSVEVSSSSTLKGETRMLKYQAYHTKVKIKI